MKSKRHILLSLLILMSAIAHATERWVDLTGTYFKDPTFSNNTTAVDWTYDQSTYNGRGVAAGCFEWWNVGAQMYKTIENVPNGHYRLSLQALWRSGSHDDAYSNYVNGSETLSAQVEVNAAEADIPSEYTFGFGSDPGNGTYHAPNGKYYPNSMESAAMAFAQGAYQMAVEFDVTDGKIDIDIFCNNNSDCWLVMDNVKLEQWKDMPDEKQAAAGDIVVNELMASAADMVWSDATNFDSWIELYNTTDSYLTLAGLWLSDDGANPKKWHLPQSYKDTPLEPHGFRTIFMGSNETNQSQATFKLDCDGGTVILSNDAGTFITRQTYPKAISRTSYARTDDGAEAWSFSDQPTPGTSNHNMNFASQRLAAPVVSPDGQYFNGTLNVYVSIPEGTTLRYTTDGTIPTLTNGKTSTTGYFETTQTTNYRFRLFQDGLLASPVVTRSYLLQSQDITLPVVMITVPDQYINDDYYGIFVKGTNGVVGNGQSTPANWNMEWNRPANFQYILPDNSMALNQDVNITPSGGWTRAGSPHAYKIKAAKVFEGLNYLPYSFFSRKPYNKNKTLQMRYGGNDGSRIKDAALQTFLRKADLNIDYQEYQPALSYLNTEYNGIINLREPNNKDFAYANFGYSDEEIEMMEESPDSGRYMMVGTMDTLKYIDQIAQQAEDDAVYKEICRLVDIDEYTNYMAMELFLAQWDWPDNNFKAYRKVDGGRYRITTFDLDMAFSLDGRDTSEGPNYVYMGGNTFKWLDGMQYHTFDALYDGTGRREGEIESVTFFFNLLKNSTFRKKFIDTFCIMGGSVYTPEMAEEIINELRPPVSPYLSPSALNEIKNKVTYDRMTTQVTNMKNYERMQLTDVTMHDVSLQTNVDANAGQLYIDSIRVPRSRFNGKLFNPATIVAKAGAGYKFTGWKKTGSASSNTIFDTGSEWKYYDKGSLDVQGWYNPGYDDSSWSSGKAMLGYDDDNSKFSTVISYGPDAENKIITYYFRRQFNLDAKPASDAKLYLDYIVDDGFVVYINGKEAGRYNLSAGSTYSTYASTADSNPDTGSLALDASLFKQGENTIAVEVHNNRPGSTDIMWEAALRSEGTTTVGDYIAYDPKYALPIVEGSLNLMACFEELTDEERAAEGLTPVVVNEVSAANSIYMSEYNKKADWMELYNTTSSDIDLAGMYLSDNAAKPHKYVIAGNDKVSTILPAHGYRVIWCDKNAAVSDLHASFKLAAEGGIVMITAKDDSWSDKLSYGAHNGDETVGRYPDGAQTVYKMNIPTINKTNMMTTYASLQTQEQTDIKGVTTSSSNGLRLFCVGNELILRSEEPTTARLMVYSTDGSLMLQTNADLRNGKATQSLAALPQGLYLARAIDSDGNSVSTKCSIR